MSAEAAIIEGLAKVAIAILGPLVEDALRGGEPVEDVIARLRAARPVVRDVAEEDRARRERLAAAIASVSRVSEADVDVVRKLSQSPALSGEERASTLRLVGLVAHALRAESP